MITSKTQIEELLKTDIEFTNQQAFEIIRYCSSLLAAKETEPLGRDIVIRLCEKKRLFGTEFAESFSTLLEAYGLFPYIDEMDGGLRGSSKLRFEYHGQNNLKIHLHEQQQIITNYLSSNKSVVLSAPTSFGKSLIIEELVASKKFKNLVIIQPTLALLDETRKKLNKYANQYSIIVSTSQPAQQSNIFLFTAERVLEYQTFPPIDFFVIDEFYKLSLSRDDDRAISLNAAFYRLLKMTNLFYLLGPVVNSVPESFISKYEFEWIKSNFCTVAVNQKFIDTSAGIDKNFLLFQQLKDLNSPTLIYCSSPEKATNLAIEFFEFTKNISKKKSPNIRGSDLSDWIREYIHRDWALPDLLDNGIGIHHGAIPRHICSTIVDKFNLHEINYLFCTSTLIEGVNTSAENVILFDKKKGRKPIDFFDFKNISGRAGRFKKYFVGNVINFEKEPTQLELDIEMPIITQENAPVEILINIDETELSETSLKKINELGNLENEFKFILKKHCSLPLKGLIEIYHLLSTDISLWEITNWSGFPAYKELLPVLELCWKYLLRKGESLGGIRSYKQLATLTIQYSIYKNIKALIDHQLYGKYWIETEPEIKLRANKITYFILNVQRHWFDYKLPRLLVAISDIREYISKKFVLKGGDFTYFASQVENGFLPQSASLLREFNIPSSVFSKIQIPDTIKDHSKFFIELKEVAKRNSTLTAYERSKILEA